MYKITEQGVSTTSPEGLTMFIPEDLENSDWVVYLEWIKAGNSPEPQFTSAEIAEKDLRIANSREEEWRSKEMSAIAVQLLSIEDDDPTRYAGTEAEWREYRIKVRAWTAGAYGYPKVEMRPSIEKKPLN